MIVAVTVFGGVPTPSMHHLTLSPHPAALRQPPGASPSVGLGAPTSLDDWPTYGYSSERSGYNSFETTITPSNAAELNPVWTTWLNDSLLGSLIVVNRTVYVGDRGGYVAAMNVTSGALLGPNSSRPWENPFLGRTTYSTCGGASGPSTKKNGLLATPTLFGDRIYENGGNTSFYTLSLSGKVLQRVDVGNHTTKASPWYRDYLWSSPLVYHGSAYVGIGALCEFNDGDPVMTDWKYIQGQLVEVNLTTGAVTATWNATKGTSSTDLGGSIWSTPAVDPWTNTVWVTTGNMNGSSETPAHGEYPQSMVALNATNLNFLGGCQVGYSTGDQDYGAGPTLFTDARGDRYVGALNKNGVFYAYNATDPSGGDCGTPGTGNLHLAWSDSFCAGQTPGTISPAAFDGNYLYIASDGCGNSSGYVDQVYPSNGTVRWSHSMYSPPAQAHAGVAAADGLVAVAANNMSSGNVGPGELQVLDAATGRLLYQHKFVAETNGWPVIAEGTIFVAAGNATNGNPGFVAAFRVPLNASLQVGNAECAGTASLSCTLLGSLAGFTINPTGGAPLFSCSWDFGDGERGSGCSAGHRYASPGTFPVTGSITDAAGASVLFRLNVIAAAGPIGSSVSPVARVHEVLVYDAAENLTLLYGGECTAALCSGQILNDTWEFANGTWTNLTAELRPSPPALIDSAAVYDPAMQGVVLVGGARPNGSGSPVLTDQMWEFAHDEWSNFSVKGGRGLPPLAGASASMDPATGALLVFGGLTGPSTATGVAQNATWTWSGQVWSAARSSVMPEARAFAGLTLYTSGGSLLMFGGRGPNGTELNDTWTYSDGNWSRLATLRAPPSGDSMVLLSEGPTAPVLLWNGADPTATWEFSAGAWRPLALSVHPASVEPGAAGALVGWGNFALVLDGGPAWVYRNATWASIPPAVTVSVTPPTVVAGRPVTLSANLIGGLAPYSYNWNITGGTPSTATGASDVVQFATSGNYTVRVRVLDSIGDASAAEANITASRLALLAAFASFPSLGEVGVALNFSAVTPNPPGEVNFSWAFGDGTAAQTGFAVTHAFASDGVFSVNLTVSDAEGDHASANGTVVVRPAVALASLEPVPVRDVGQLVESGATIIYGVPPYSVVVEFGDGANVSLTTEPLGSSSGVPLRLAHPYSWAGEYTENLSVSDALGGQYSAHSGVRVNPHLALPKLALPSGLSPGSDRAYSVTISGGTPPYNVTWAFGDGSHATGQNTTHAYAQSGGFPVTVTITDAAGASITATGSVQVAGPPTNSDGTIAAIGIVVGAMGVAGFVWWRRHRRRSE